MNRTHFWIPAADPRAAEEELNLFVRAHRVLSVEEVFVADGAGSAWAVSVSWLDGVQGSAAQRKGRAFVPPQLTPRQQPAADPARAGSSSRRSASPPPGAGSAPAGVRRLPGSFSPSSPFERPIPGRRYLGGG